MTDPTGFSPLVPGFEFMQSLVKSAGAALPGVGQWVTPTIDPEEIAKRIQELRTVQFWLEQNARMLGATIQAMEVQRMTLSTLKTMNVQMGDLREAMKIRVPDMPTAGASPPSTSSSSSGVAPSPAAAGTDAAAAPAAPGIVDPLQWWGALTRQFTELATTAMKDGSSEAARATGVAGASGAAAPTFVAAAAASAPDAAPGARPGKTAPPKKPASDR